MSPPRWTKSIASALPDLSLRLIAALIALPFALLFVYLGGVWGALLLLILGLVAGWEFFHMMTVGGYHPARWAGLPWLTAIWLSLLRPDLMPLSFVLAIGLIGTMAISLFTRNRPADTWFSTVTGSIYLGIALGMTALLRTSAYGMWWLYFALLTAWANDTMAYFVGVFWGAHKLWPRVSPKKTWEGSIGGWVGAALMALLFAWFSPIPLCPLPALIIGVLVGVLALIGDLTISMLKRQVGVKDSGRIFPGHGGVLDRMDSLLFVVPVVYMIVATFF
ncbi:MAG: phosphatidate cytidylyltransferase [Caldilineaceae bacterium]|nr:phosphatidate cytidylyltransferase [Caldilineaceae bacterium]